MGTIGSVKQTRSTISRKPDRSEPDQEHGQRKSGTLAGLIANIFKQSNVGI
jgi:hypothetical protein